MKRHAAVKKPSHDKRDYDYWRKHSFKAETAIALARAEAWGRSLSLQVLTSPEEERYEDVYGEKPPKGVEFVTVWIIPEGGGMRDAFDNTGMVEDSNESIREAGANMLLGLMQQGRTSRDPRSRSRAKRGTKKMSVSRDPHKPFIVAKTYEVVTPESAEYGDAEERGFEYEDTPMTLRDVMREIYELGYFEGQYTSTVNPKYDNITLYQGSEGDVDYQTGAETRYALHIKAPANALKRIDTVLKDKSQTRLRSLLVRTR
jgi:hypothetical protein